MPWPIVDSMIKCVRVPNVAPDDAPVKTMKTALVGVISLASTFFILFMAYNATQNLQVC